MQCLAISYFEFGSVVKELLFKDFFYIVDLT